MTLDLSLAPADFAMMNKQEQGRKFGVLADKSMNMMRAS